MVPGAAVVLGVALFGWPGDWLAGPQGVDPSRRAAELDARLGGHPVESRPPAAPGLSGPLPPGLAEISGFLGYAEGGRAKLHPSLGQSRGNLGPADGATGGLRGRYGFTVDPDAFLTLGAQWAMMDVDDRSSSAAIAPSATVVQDQFRLQAAGYHLLLTGGAALATSDRFFVFHGEFGLGGMSSRVRLGYDSGANPGGPTRFASSRDLLPAVRAAFTLGFNLPGTRLRGALRRDWDESADPATERNWRRRTVFGFRIGVAYTATPDLRVDFRDGGRAMRYDASYLEVTFGISLTW